MVSPTVPHFTHGQCQMANVQTEVRRTFIGARIDVDVFLQPILLNKSVEREGLGDVKAVLGVVILSDIELLEESF